MTTPTPYYKDDLATILQGDCIDVMRGLDSGSIDAVVTDPPYGLEFMGKEWDGADGFRRSLNPADAGRESVFGRTSRTSPEYRTDSKSTAAVTATGYTDGARRLARPDHVGGLNPKCLACGKWQRGANPCRCETPEWTQERLVRLHAFQEWCEVWATECLRVLKPGGYLVAFGGSRTWHRLACAIEDAGFEIRDSIAWLYGSGFPKSLDVSKAIDKATGAEREVANMGSTSCADFPDPCSGHPAANGSLGGGVMRHAVPTMAASADAEKWQGWGTALKPAFEPQVVARKPLAGTVAANVLEHGTGALNIDACRINTNGEALHTSTVPNDMRGGHYGSGHRPGEPSADRRYTDSGGTNFAATPGPRGGDERGRWPTNVVLDGHMAAELDKETGVLTSGANPTRRGTDKFRDAYGEFTGQEACIPARGADSGGASRFFPVFHYEAKAPQSERPRDGDIAHPTVKPLDYMRWLVRLVTPPGGLVLDPFLGSGTTAEACVIEGFRCIGIEREPAYLPLAVARLSKPIEAVLDFGAAS